MRSSATRTSRRILAAAACLATAGLVASWAAADKVTKADTTASYSSPAAAYRIGLVEWDFGRNAKAVQAFEYAASKGVLGAQLKLAEFYANGSGVERSDARAFAYYQAIADGFADVNPRHSIAPYISTAFVRLASYYRNGVKELDIKASPAHAAALYRHAASYFGHVDAQYSLALMYLNGEGVDRNDRLGVNWLANATRKNHAPSQAKLGELLWEGSAGLQRQPRKALALLTVAERNAAGDPALEWIGKLRQQVLLAMSETEKEQAAGLVARWTGAPVKPDDPGNGSLGAAPAPESSSVPPRSGIMTVGTSGEVTH